MKNCSIGYKTNLTGEESLGDIPIAFCCICSISYIIYYRIIPLYK